MVDRYWLDRAATGHWQDHMGEKHILVVEDDDSLRSGIVDLLEFADYRVTAAADGAEAMERLHEMAQPPALIVSDIRMPRLDGYELLEAVRARPEWVSIPFIFLSAKGDKQDVRQGKLRGADDYVSKPFDFEDLLVAIESSLSRHQQINAAQEARLDAIKRRILHIINHEFRTPLTFIVAYADMMASDPTFQHSEEVSQYIEGILEGGERLHRLVENFLVLAELESGLGRKIYERRQEPISDLGQIIADVVGKAEEKAAARAITIDIAVDEPLPVVSGDPTYLALAIRELLDNGVRFSPNGAGVAVIVQADERREWVSVTVCDQGPGIPVEEQGHLFDAFYQVNREELEQGGAGAGLAIANHIARLHGGWLSVESEVGVGSCVGLVLPAATPATA